MIMTAKEQQNKQHQVEFKTAKSIGYTGYTRVVLTRARNNRKLHNTLTRSQHILNDLYLYGQLGVLSVTLGSEELKSRITPYSFVVVNFVVSVVVRFEEDGRVKMFTMLAHQASCH